MKVVVKGRKTIYHDKLGALRPGWGSDGRGEMDDKSALRYLAQGAVERYETKVIREIPLPVAGVAEPLSALPVGQASTETTAEPSEGGARKRGRPRKASSQ